MNNIQSVPSCLSNTAHMCYGKKMHELKKYLGLLTNFARNYLSNNCLLTVQLSYLSLYSVGLQLLLTSNT